MSGVTLTSAKERHYAYLSSRMDALAVTLQHTQHYMNIASEQAAYMKELGLGQAAIFMAALDQVDRENDTNTATD
ncbi:Hypothetical protein MSYG_1405 [Malassezia sympodialis ATCC 42132]|uniref:Uncharacterized protein n=1 Tax=Malassezia sympodialis (strain ATCC 42132) TaxID=1230383 RepID=A0A1M8A3Q8_MALS4|nr:Hypothetical protein MSYG_1405 [Malassezia sympodialis ATCC 42132]